MDAESGSSSPERLPVSLLGETLGRYQVERRLGAGGMGEVYLAWDTTLRRHVAIKRMAATASGDDSFSSRLIEEAQNASSISDPRIAEVYDVLCLGGEIFLVLEYVEGRRLRDRMSSPLGLDEFFAVAIPCAEALSAAHQAGIVHLDIKPENIMIKPSGQLKILDFGVAKRLPSPLDSVESTHSFINYKSMGGTPSYMAPEVLLGRAVDARADLYSLGVVFYEMLSGRRPFDGQTLAATIEQTLHGEPLVLCTLASSVPKSLSHVVMRLLSREPEMRHPNAQDLLADLLTVQRDAPGITRTVGEPLMSARAVSGAAGSRGRRWVWLAALGACAALVAAVASVSTTRRWLLQVLGQSWATGNYIAVLSVETDEADAEMAAFCGGVTEEVTNALLRMAGTRPLQVVKASRVRTLKSNSPHKAGEVFGVDCAIGGRLETRREETSVDWVLRDTSDGKRLRNRRARAAANDPIALMQASLVAISALLDRGIADAKIGMLTLAQSLALLRPTTRIPTAYHFYLEGIGYLHEPRPDPESARQSFTQALSIDPGLARAHVGLARTAWVEFGTSKDASKLQQSLRECSAALALDDSCVEAYEVRGNVQVALDSSMAAVTTFARGLALEPRNEVLRAALARLQEKLGHDAAAERLYREGVELQPHYWLHYYELGYFCYQRDDVERAARLFEQVYALVPKYFSGYNALGGIYVLIGRYADALPILERSVSMRPSSVGYCNLGTAYFLQRDFAQAARVYQDAVQLGHADDRMWGNLGDAYYYGPASEKPRARQAYQRAIDMALAALPGNADSATVLAGLSKYHAQLGQSTESLAFLARALRADSSQADIQYTAALAYARVGQPDKALRALSQALARGYPSTWVRDTAELDELRGRADSPLPVVKSPQGA